jgi:hypothetical protein
MWVARWWSWLTIWSLASSVLRRAAGGRSGAADGVAFGPARLETGRTGPHGGRPDRGIARTRPVARASSLRRVHECLTGDARRDARTNHLLKTCEIVDILPSDLARRAAWLRTKARRGSAIDALVVATADPGGAVLTGDPKDLIAIADHAHEVSVHLV